MVEKISVQIALEGGAEIARQLEDIGQAGQKAFADLANSAAQVGGFKNLKPEEVTAKLQQMGITGVDAINKIQRAIQQAGRLESIVQGVQSVENALLGLARALPVIGVAAVAAFTAAAKATIAFAETLNKTSDQAVKLGLSFEQFKNLQNTLETIGVSSQAAASGFGKFEQELQKAAQADPGSNLALFGLNADAAQQQLARFLDQLRQMPDGLQRTNLAIAQLGETAGIQFIQGLRAAEGSMSTSERKAYDLGQALERLSTAWKNFGSIQLAPGLAAGIDIVTASIQRLDKALTDASPKWGIFGFAAKFALSPIAAMLELITNAFGKTQQAAAQAGQGLQLVRNPFTGMPEAVNTTNQALQTTNQTLQQTGQAGTQAGAQTAQGMNTAKESTDALSSSLAPIPGTLAQIQTQGGQISAIAVDVNNLARSWAAVYAAINDAANAARYFANLPRPTTIPLLSESRPEPIGPGLAGGGLLGGGGTGTSDSNLAWVSRGEFIMPAHIVARPGMLTFLETLRHGIGFALGGLVPPRLPAFAAGGLAGGNNVTINFPGLPSISGLRASSAVVDELQRAAALAQVRSGGRKPSRYS